MKARMNIRSIIMIMATVCLASMFFINICFAANTGKVITETARLREEPNTEAKVLDLISQGEKVEVLETVDSWYKVKYKKITGYIRNDLIEIENQIKDNSTNTIEVNENVTTEEEQEDNETIKTNTASNEENTFEKGKYKILETVKLKIIPLISAIELDEVKQNTEVEVTEVLNDWAKIKTTEGKEGWVVRRRTASTGELVVLFSLPETSQITENNTENKTLDRKETSNNETKNTTKTMYANSQTINLREKPNTTSKVLKQVAINQRITVISSENEWYKVEVDGTTGYISKSLLSDTKQETSRSATTERATTQSTNTTKTEETKEVTTSSTNTSEITNSSKGSDIISYAKQFLGCKYVYGGTTTKGFDCSGFTQFVYAHFGVSLNRTAAAQYSNGTSVTNLQAGDLVMFGKSGINHVGIYIGGNTFIHAANPSRGVTTDTLASGYYKTNYVGARRIF